MRSLPMEYVLQGEHIKRQTLFQVITDDLPNHYQRPPRFLLLLLLLRLDARRCHPPVHSPIQVRLRRVLMERDPRDDAPRQLRTRRDDLGLGREAILAQLISPLHHTTRH